MTVTTLHPPISPTSIRHEPAIPGEYLINIGGVVRLIKEGDTPQCRRAYRLYLAEYRALEGQPLAHEVREGQALIAAFRRMNISFVDAGTGRRL